MKKLRARNFEIGLLIIFNLLIFFGFPKNLFDNKSLVFFLIIYEILMFVSVFFYVKSGLNKITVFIWLFFIADFSLSTMHQYSVSDYRYSLPSNFQKKFYFPPDTWFIGLNGIQTVSTDAEGFRTISKINYADSSGIRVFTVGGSTTEEIYKDNAKMWPALLEKNLNELVDTPIEVVNAGVAGLRLKHNLEQLTRIAKLHPDIVIFLVGVNDWNHDVKQFVFNNLNVPQINKIGRSLRIIEVENSLVFFAMKRILEMIKFHIDSFYISPEMGGFFESKQKFLDREVEVALDMKGVSPEYQANLEELLAWCRHEVICVFANQPTLYSLNPSKHTLDRFWMVPPDVDYRFDMPTLLRITGLYNDFLRDSVLASGFVFCDLEKNLASSLENFYDDVHFTELGSRKVASLITNCVLKTAIFDKPKN